MNTGVVKSKASGLALMGKFFVAVAVLGAGVLPQGAKAVTTNQQFQQYITDICFGVIAPPPGVNWNTVTMCSLTSTGWAGAGGPTPSVNLGTANAGSTTSSSRKKKGFRIPLDDQDEKPAKGASADVGGWGLLLTPQYGKSSRVETNLENGYQSTLSGLLVGLDYRFSDALVIGATVGQTKDDAKFLNNAGSLKTGSNVFTLYGTWLSDDGVAVDGYLGYGKLSLDSTRQVVFGTTLSGTTLGNTTGNQSMAGISVNYQKDIGRVSLTPFLNFDQIKTSIKGYSETGTTTLEMRYGDRSVTSLTSNLGFRLGSSYSYGWGSLLPTARLAAVHEFQNKSQQIRNELVITPGAGFLVETDSPDRDYLNIGLGVVAALNGGAQLFLDYEKRTQDKLLSSWAVSLGGLFEF